MPKYLNPYTDFGFKKLFGEEASKDLLVDFLNQLLPPHHQIAELHFKNTEQLANLSIERKAIFDIYCQSITGEYFIVEMQKAKLNFFKDRALFYTTFPIREQAEKGGWNFKLTPIYFVAILDFIYDEKEERQKFRHDVALKDQDGEVFFDKLHFKFLQIPLFNKQPHELENHFDKWLYFLKNLEDFDHIPHILNEPIFEKAFKISETANLTHAQWESYEKQRLDYLTLNATIETALDEGIKKGIEQGIEQGIQQGIQQGREEERLIIAKSMRESGLTIDSIMAITGLSKQQLENV